MYMSLFVYGQQGSPSVKARTKDGTKMETAVLVHVFTHHHAEARLRPPTNMSHTTVRSLVGACLNYRPAVSGNLCDMDALSLLQG